MHVFFIIWCSFNIRKEENCTKSKKTIYAIYGYCDMAEGTVSKMFARFRNKKFWSGNMRTYIRMGFGG